MTRTKTAKAKRLALRLAKANQEPRPTCPTPTKRAFTDSTEAIRKALHRSKVSGKPLRVYHCQCGSQHLTARVVPKKAA